MTPNWLNDNLCSFDEKVRVEKGPQIVELECSDENLQDSVTAPHYKVGARDAYGRVIMPERVEDKVDMKLGAVTEGGTMSVVDWRGKHAPHLWKVYQLTETEELGKDGKPVSRFLKVSEFQDKDEAIAAAAALYGEN